METYIKLERQQPVISLCKCANLKLLYYFHMTRAQLDLTQPRLCGAKLKVGSMETWSFPHKAKKKCMQVQGSPTLSIFDKGRL